MEKPRIEVQNIVAFVDLKTELDLERLAFELPDSEYDPDRFPALIVKFKEPKISFLVFRNGKMNCTGADHITKIEEGVAKLVNQLRDLGIDIKRDPKITVTNVVATVDLGLVMTERDLVLNTPMVPANSTLLGRDSDLHPLMQGWWEGQAIHYWRFESSQDTPGLFDPGTGLVREAPAYAVYDPPGQLEVQGTYPGDAAYSPLTLLYLFNPISTLYVADSVRTVEEVLGLKVPTFLEGHLYNRPVVGGREAHPRYAHAEVPTYDLEDAWYSQTSKVLYYDMGPMTPGVAPLYRFVNREGFPILTQHWLVSLVAPDVLVGDVNTQGYSTLWCFYNVVVEDESAFEPDVIKSMDDVLALGFDIEPTFEYIVAPMVPYDPVFLPAPSKPPGEGLALTWYKGADVYLVVLGPVPKGNDTKDGAVPSLRTVNLTVLLDEDGKPYTDQWPIMEDLPEDSNYSMVWSVVWASGGDGYRPGRLRTTQQLRERGWSFEPSGQLILGGFVAGPINVPAWRPERFTFVVGPVVDEDGDPVKGASVRVTIPSMHGFSRG